jgi:hypothetical protein
MALGFQDCCNSSSYFYLDGIPATVSQNEFYHILTLEGPAFCATYTTIPALNYLPPTYTLDEMTEYTSCQTCFVGAPLTCPAQETIFLSQFGPGSISVGTDCSIRTLFPMIVECFSTNPTFDGFADGVVRLFVTGGTPPYSFFNVTDGTTFGGALPVENSIYTLIDGALEGQYPIQVVDAQADFNLTVNCVLESPPTEIQLNANANAVSIADACDGTIVIEISNGTPPYQIFVNGIPYTETTLTDLCAGDYEITVIDSGVGTDQQITSTTVSVGSPNTITYPDDICLRISYCETVFNLTFNRQGSYNFRANYVCDNPEDLGLTQLILRWEAGWTTTQETSNGNINFTSPCPPLPSSIIQFVKTSPQTEQPIGSWQSNVGLFQGESGTLIEGVCVLPDPDIVDPDTPGPVVAPTLSLTTTNASCGAAPLGQVILVGSGGAGGPYTYLINGVAQASSTVSLPPGNYIAAVLDVSSVTSLTSNFTIGTTPPQNITMSISTSVDTTLEIFNETTDNSNVAGCGVPCLKYVSYQPVKTVVSIIGAPSVPITGYFNITVKKQSQFNDFYISAIQTNTNEIDFSTYLSGQVPIPRTFDSTSPSLSTFSEPTYTYTNEVVTTGTRPFGLNNNLTTATQSNGCPAGTQYRTVTRQLTIGSAAAPVEIYNEIPLEFYVPIDNKYRAQQNATCQPAVGVQITVEFVKTSANINCYNFIFNGGISPYVASAKQVGDTQYLPQIYTNTTIIN